jgi:hypothetical protein
LKVLFKEGQKFPREGFELSLGNANNSLRRRLLTLPREGQEFFEEGSQLYLGKAKVP